MSLREIFGMSPRREPDQAPGPTNAHPSAECDRDEDARKNFEHVEGLAREAEASVLEKREEVLAKCLAEHERDVAAYRFECRRWGDFLGLSVARLARTKWWTDECKLATLATSVNIRDTRALRLDEGHPADSNGVLTYGLNKRKRGDAIFHSSGTGDGFYTPPPGYYWHVFPLISDAPWRGMFTLDCADRNHASGMELWRYDIKHTTPNWPRMAEDDRIMFEGAKATLYVPAGLGKQVYETVLKEIGDFADARPSARTEQGNL